MSGGLPLTLDGVNDERVGAYARYGTAKLASLAFSAELSRRRRHRGVLSVAVHPGVVATSLLRRDNFGAMLAPHPSPNLRPYPRPNLRPHPSPAPDPNWLQPELSRGASPPGAMLGPVFGPAVWALAQVGLGLGLGLGSGLG